MMGFAKEAMKIWTTHQYQVNQDYKKDLARIEMRLEIARAAQNKVEEIKELQTKHENNVRTQKLSEKHLGNIIDTYV
jgi:hypothetical protein